MLRTFSPYIVGALLRAWRRWGRPLGERIEEEAYLLAKKGLLPGFRLVIRERRLLDGPLAHQVLLRRYGEEVADKACPRQCSRTGLRAALRAQVTPGTLEKEVEAAVAELEKVGGVKVQRSEALVPGEAGHDEDGDQAHP
jgi:hypothetical protein